MKCSLISIWLLAPLFSLLFRSRNQHYDIDVPYYLVCTHWFLPDLHCIHDDDKRVLDCQKEREQEALFGSFEPLNFSRWKVRWFRNKKQPWVTWEPFLLSLDDVHTTGTLVLVKASRYKTKRLFLENPYSRSYRMISLVQVQVFALDSCAHPSQSYTHVQI